MRKRCLVVWGLKDILVKGHRDVLQRELSSFVYVHLAHLDWRMIDRMDHIRKLGYEPTKTEDADQERSGH